MVEDLTNNSPEKASELLWRAIARMQAAPEFFSQEEWSLLASYEGQAVSGNPDGKVPDDLENDDE